MDESKKILAERFNKLPKDVQTAVRAADLRTKLQAIAQKQRLHIDQAGILEDEVILVMLGLESPDDFVDNLKREAKIPDAQAKLIMQDVNNEIFLPIRESLQKVTEKDLLEEQQTEKTIPRVSIPSQPGVGAGRQETGDRSKEYEVRREEPKKALTPAPSYQPTPPARLTPPPQVPATRTFPATSFVGAPPKPTSPAPQQPRPVPPTPLSLGAQRPPQTTLPPRAQTPANMAPPKPTGMGSQSAIGRPAPFTPAPPKPALPPERAHILKEIETMAKPQDAGTRNKELGMTGSGNREKEIVGSEGTPGAPHHSAPSPQNLPTGNIAEAKLGGMFSLPKDERVTGRANTPPPPPASTPREDDPYREPVDTK